jgi:hypothetical protein
MTESEAKAFLDEIFNVTPGLLRRTGSRRPKIFLRPNKVRNVDGSVETVKS